MLIFFIILSIALAAGNVYLYKKRIRAENREEAQYKNSIYWNQKWSASDEMVQALHRKYALKRDACKALEKALAAHEQGRDEESEAYEQQYLSFVEIVGKQEKLIEKYAPIYREHMRNCLPDLPRIEALHWWFDDYEVENTTPPIFQSVVLDMSG